jgi:hypothetical protein
LLNKFKTGAARSYRLKKRINGGVNGIHPAKRAPVFKDKKQSRPRQKNQQRHKQDNFAMIAKFASTPQRKPEYVVQDKETQPSQYNQKGEDKQDGNIIGKAQKLGRKKRLPRITKRRYRMKNRHKEPVLDIAPVKHNRQNEGPYQFDCKRKYHYASYDAPWPVFNIAQVKTFYGVGARQPKTPAGYDEGEAAKTYYSKPAYLYQAKQGHLPGSAKLRYIYSRKPCHAYCRGGGKYGVGKTQIPRPRAAEFQYQCPGKNKRQKKAE